MSLLGQLKAKESALLWFLCFLIRLPPTSAAIAEVNDSRAITFVVDLMPEDGEFFLSLSDNGSAARHPQLKALADLRPGYEQIVMDIRCVQIVSIETKLHLEFKHRLSPEFVNKAKKKMIDDLRLGAGQLHLETIQERDGVSVMVTVIPGANDAKAAWLAPLRRMRTHFPSNGLFLARGPKLGFHFLNETVLGAFTSSLQAKLLNETQRVRTEPCKSALDIQGTYKPDPAHNSTFFENHWMPKIAYVDARNDSAMLTYGACSMPSGQFNVDVTLHSGNAISTTSKEPSANTSLIAITVDVAAKDTRPYEVSCVALSRSHTGHSLTQVGPYMVMFGGLAAVPGTYESVPVSELWVIHQHHADNTYGWVSLDRTHNIFIKPRARYGHVAAATSDGLFVIYGGHSGKEYLHDVWAIRMGHSQIDANPLQHDVIFPPFRWRQCYSSANFPKASLMATGLVDTRGQLYVFGGQQDKGGLSNELWSLDLEKLTPSEAKWTSIWPLRQLVPSERFGHSLVWLPARPTQSLAKAGFESDFAKKADLGGMLLFGGVEMLYAALALKNDLWYFDVAMHRWVSLEAAEDAAPNNHPASATRPPPLVFHAAASLGTAMVLIGGITSAMRTKANPSGFEVRSDIWRWTDDDGWSLQFASWAGDSARANAPSEFKHVLAGAMQYWPEIGKLLLYGGQSTVQSWCAWDVGVAHVQQERVSSQYVPVSEYFPPIFSNVPASLMKSDVLLVELEACVFPSEQSNALMSSAPPTLQKVCLPCSIGATIFKGSPNAEPLVDNDFGDPSSGLPITRAQFPPWINRSAHRCEPCRAGTIYNGGRCWPCPAGFFGAFKGMDSWRMCLPCRADHYSEEIGSHTCKPCPKPERNANITDKHADFAATLAHHGDTAPAAVNKDKDLASRTCPLYSESSAEILEHQSVHEMNEPHGQNPQAQHLFWQEICIQVWAAVVSCSMLLLLLVQSRRPRSVAVFVRQFDMRPITAAQVSSEAGGVVFMCYVVTCSCMAVVWFAHLMLYNSQLTSMSVPSQEESRRVGQIEVDLIATATLLGYTGPCVEGDFEEGPWDLGSAQHPRNLQSSSWISKQEHADTWIALDSVGGGESLIRVREDFALHAKRDRILRHQTLQLEPQVEDLSPLHGRGHHVSASYLDANSFVLRPSIGEGMLDETVRVDHERIRREGRNLENQAQIWCHRFVTMTPHGITLGDGKDLNNKRFHVTCKRVGDRQCRVSFSCRKCSILKETAHIRLNVSAGYIFTAAREIHWHVKANWLRPASDSTAAYSLVESIVTSGDFNKCLRGPRSSLVRMTLVPTDYQNLLQASHLYGFVLQFIDARRGSVADQSQFHENSPQLHSRVEFHASRSFYKLVLSHKRTTFDFLTQMLGFLSGMSLIARVLLAVWHSLSSKIKEGSACFWTNPFIRCLSSIFCCCIEEETEEDKCRKSVPDMEAMAVLLSRHSSADMAGKYDGLPHASGRIVDLDE